MSGFSGALQLSALDDFITPSQQCVKPVIIDKVKSKTGAKITIQEDGYYEEVEGGIKHKLQKVEITLKDCLACSGCITSAEGVLINQQSHEELIKVLHENMKFRASESDQARTIVFTVSQQPILNLAHRYELCPEDAAKHLCGYIRQLGADYVLITKVADDIALLECREEFVERYRDQIHLPMLSSSCPGWVCYAEKTHGNFILPHISTTRSPQQIMGVLVKQLLAEKLGVGRNRIYHVTVMPCYDKKLEASREDFYDEVLKSRDVDCVITSIELEKMLNLDGKSLQDFSAKEFDWPWNDNKPEFNVWAHEYSASGGYSDHIFKHAAKELFQEDFGNLEYKNIRNPDFREISLEKDGKCLLKFAIANGFRNIQNLVQKLKRGKVQYHFVEVMACPAGCINGGAQIRPPASTPVRELIFKMEEHYRTLPKSSPANSDAEKILKNFFNGQHSDKAKTLLHTSYHSVQKINTSLNIKW